MGFGTEGPKHSQSSPNLRPIFSQSSPNLFPISPILPIALAFWFLYRPQAHPPWTRIGCLVFLCKNNELVLRVVHIVVIAYV
jgi:hypothetical protein